KIRYPSDQHMGSSSGKRSKTHDKHTGPYCGFQLIMHDASQDQKHHHTPPAPVKPQINPITEPQINESAILPLKLFSPIASLVVITGRIRNLTPSRNVMITEKSPIV